MSVDPVSVATSILGAFLVGLLCGGMIKYLKRVMGFIIGVFIALITYLDFIDIITVEWDQINRDTSVVIDSIISLGQPDKYSTEEFTEVNGIAVGFVVGLIVGYRVV